MFFFKIFRRPGYHCEVCNATCSAKDAFHAHLNGAKHNRVSFFKKKRDKFKITF